MVQLRVPPPPGSSADSSDKPGDTSADWTPSPTDTPFERLGGWERIHALAHRFYDEMEKREPALAAIHRRDEAGRISTDSRERFALFLQGWLGGPQTYMEKHGHPRLRMRHAAVTVDGAMRDAWLRSMSAAMDGLDVKGGLRTFLDARFAEVADFLRNTEEG